MAFPAVLVKLLPSMISGFGKILGGDKGKKMEEAGQIAGEVSRQYETNSLPPDKRAALETAIMQHEQKIKEIALEEYRLEMGNLKDMRDLVKTSLRSEDPFVRRARPMFLWLVYVIVIVHFVIFPIIWMLFPTIGKPPVNVSELLKYFIWAYLGYGGYRTIDKKGSNIKKLVDGIKGFTGMKRTI